MMANDVRQAAADFLARGIQVVPLPAKSKAPRLANWQRGGFGSERFRADDNIGILLGEPSGGLLDVDLDCPEALALAPNHLPPTAQFGRDSRPASHWVYLVDEACGKTHKWKKRKWYLPPGIAFYRCPNHGSTQHASGWGAGSVGQ